MAIDIHAPDGSIITFPDGTPSETISSVMGSHFPPPKTPSFADTASDVLKSGVTGVAKGVTGLAGLPGDIGRMEEGALSWAGNKLGLGDSVQHGFDWYNQHVGNYIAPTSQQLNSAVQSHIVPYHEPQTTAGKYAQTIGEFAPAAFAGPEGIAPKIASVVAPAVASEAAGQATEGTGLEPVARTVGAVLGGGAAGLAERAPALVKSLVKPPTDIERATAYIGQKLQSAGLTPSTAGPTLDAAIATGKPLTAAEVLGKPAEVGIGALARREGATADALGGAMASRGADASNRILGDYAASAGIHPSAAQGNFDSLLQAGKAKASPLYEQAYAANQNVSSPSIDRILSTPAGRTAMRTASNMMQNDQSLMAVRDPDLLEQAREAGQDIPWKGGVASGLKLRSLDYVKQALDDQINSAFRSGDKAQGSILVGLKNKLLNALDQADVTAAAGPNSLKPEGGLYAQARKAASDNFRLKNVFDDAQKDILSSNVTANDIAKKLAGLTDIEKETYKGGIANKLFNLTQNNRLNLKLFDAPIVQQKLSSSLGPQNAQKFLDALKVEKGMANFARLRVPGAGSPTAEYNAEMAVQDANPLAQAAIQHGGNIASHGVVGGLLKSGAGKLNDILAGYATRGMPVEARNEAGRILMMSPSDFKVYLGQIEKTGALPKQSQSLLPYFTQAMLGSALAAPAVSSQAQ